MVAKIFILKPHKLIKSISLQFSLRLTEQRFFLGGGHFASPHIFHYIYIELSSSTLSVFWHLYLVLIGVLGVKNILWISFYQNIEIQQNLLLM